MASSSTNNGSSKKQNANKSPMRLTDGALEELNKKDPPAAKDGNKSASVQQYIANNENTRIDYLNFGGSSGVNARSSGGGNGGGAAGGSNGGTRN